jgi:hypothetical protein
MNFLIEKNPWDYITLKSIQKNCSADIVPIIVDNVEMYLDEIDNNDPVFFVRGNSVKIVTDKFERFLNESLFDLPAMKFNKQYPGAYIKQGYSNAYKWDGIKLVEKSFDTDVMIVRPKKYRELRNASSIQLKEKKLAALLVNNLNAKDDYLITTIVEPYDLLRRNVWIKNKAGLINLSIDAITDDSIECALGYPFEILLEYVDDNFPFIDNIKNKINLTEQLCGKIRQVMIGYGK